MRLDLQEWRNGLLDGQEDVIGTIQDLSIVETQNGKTLVPEKAVSLHVVLFPMGCLMTVAIDLDDYTR